MVSTRSISPEFCCNTVGQVGWSVFSILYLRKLVLVEISTSIKAKPATNGKMQYLKLFFQILKLIFSFLYYRDEGFKRCGKSRQQS